VIVDAGTASGTGQYKLGEYHEGIDSILAEQELLATVKKDPLTKKCSLVGFRLLEE